MNIHPEYVRARKSLIALGWVAILTGVLGLALPMLPGVVLLFAGISLLSMTSSQSHYYSARFRMRFPKLSEDVKLMETKLVELFRLGTHTHKYIRIPTPQGSLRGILEESKFAAGVAIVLHSASGTMETPVSNILAEACRAEGLTVLRFDARHGLNEHGTTFAQFTTTSFYEDLGAVLMWARTQSWWHGPLTLVGHSIGGLVVTRYAEEHPDDVSRLILFSPTISGSLYVKAFMTADPQGFTRWRETRLRAITHPLAKETFGISFGFVDDLMQYDLLHKASALTMPMTIYSGSLDVTTPPEDCKVFSETVGPHAHFVQLDDVHHTPTTRSELRTLRNALIGTL